MMENLKTYEGFLSGHKDDEVVEKIIDYVRRNNVEPRFDGNADEYDFRINGEALQREPLNIEEDPFQEDGVVENPDDIRIRCQRNINFMLPTTSYKVYVNNYKLDCSSNIAHKLWNIFKNYEKTLIINAKNAEIEKLKRRIL